MKPSETDIFYDKMIKALESEGQDFDPNKDDDSKDQAEIDLNFTKEPLLSDEAENDNTNIEIDSNFTDQSKGDITNNEQTEPLLSDEQDPMSSMNDMTTTDMPPPSNMDQPEIKGAERGKVGSLLYGEVEGIDDTDIDANFDDKSTDSISNNEDDESADLTAEKKRNNPDMTGEVDGVQTPAEDDKELDTNELTNPPQETTPAPSSSSSLRVMCEMPCVVVMRWLERGLTRCLWSLQVMLMLMLMLLLVVAVVVT